MGEEVVRLVVRGVLKLSQATTLHLITTLIRTQKFHSCGETHAASL